MPDSTTMATATMASQYTPGPADAASRIGAAVAYVNSLIKDVFDGGYTVIVSETHICPKAVGGLDARTLPQIRVNAYAPGEKIVSRAEVNG